MNHLWMIVKITDFIKLETHALNQKRINIQTKNNAHYNHPRTNLC